MLKVQAKERMQECIRFAKEHGIADKLCETLRYLNGYACHVNDGNGNEFVDPTRTRCILYHDFAPLSFGFVMQRRKSAAFPLASPPVPTTEPIYENGSTVESSSTVARNPAVICRSFRSRSAGAAMLGGRSTHEPREH